MIFSCSALLVLVLLLLILILILILILLVSYIRAAVQSITQVASEYLGVIDALDFVEAPAVGATHGRPLAMDDTGIACPIHQHRSLPRRLWSDNASPMASMGSSSPMIPYAGSFGGFMPYRMAGGSSSPVSFSSRGSAVLESTRTPFRSHADVERKGYGLGSGQRIICSAGLTRRHATWRWLYESTHGRRRQHERHATQFRLSLLPAAQPDFARLTQSWHVDVTFESP